MRILDLSTCSFFDQNFHKIFFSYFAVRYVFFRFLVSNKDLELVHVFFVYFVGFVICFIIVTKVLYLRMSCTS